MRNLGILALILAGCDGTMGTSPSVEPGFDADEPEIPAAEGDFLDHNARVEADAIDGIDIQANGSKVHVGIYGATCSFRTANGQMDEDQDVENGDDEVEDGDDDDQGNGHRALISGSTDTVTLRHIEQYRDIASWTVRGHVASRIVDTESIVSLAERDGGCVVEWHTTGSPSARVVDVASGACAAGSIDVDPSGTAWVSTGDALVGIDSGGITDVAAGADVTVWDEASQAFYGFDYGTSLVSAWERDGTARWTATVAGTIAGIDDMNGDAVVSIDGADGAEIVLLDGVTGSQLASQEVSGQAGELEFSGGTLGHIHPSSVDLYAVAALSE